MTIQEASEKYNIPIKILREYETWELWGEVKSEKALSTKHLLSILSAILI